MKQFLPWNPYAQNMCVECGFTLKLKGSNLTVCLVVEATGRWTGTHPMGLILSVEGMAPGSDGLLI